MILGRNPGLWAGLVQAGINLVAAFIVVHQGTDLTAAEAAVLIAANAFGAAIVAVVANAGDPSTVPTFALTTHPAADAAPSPAASPSPTPAPTSAADVAGASATGSVAGDASSSTSATEPTSSSPDPGAGA